MDAGKIIIGFLLMIGMLCMSGCVNEGTTTKKTFENIDFESEIVEIANAYIDYNREEMYDDSGDMYYNTRSIEVKYLLHNPAERAVTVQVVVYLYDEFGMELYSEGPYVISLPAGYTESGANTISYAGTDVATFDHARIVAIEQQ